MENFRTISIWKTEGVCLNCEHYRLFYTKNKGNIDCYFQTSEGRCKETNKQCNPLKKKCGKFKNIVLA